MNNTQLHTLDQVEVFLAGTEAVDFSFTDTAARYVWMAATLIRFATSGWVSSPKRGTATLSAARDRLFAPAAHAPCGAL